MRLPYVPNPPPNTNDTDAAIVERVKQRRGAQGLVELDLTLLHAPPVADGWNSFLGAVRQRTSLPASIRELAICRVAALNHAQYEWIHHFPLLEEAMPGLSAGEVDYVRNAASLSTVAAPINAMESLRKSLPGLDDKHLAALAYTDAMTTNVKVPREVFEAVRGVFSEREVVEITATIGAYNCVSRFLVALDVGEAVWDGDMKGK